MPIISINFILCLLKLLLFVFFVEMILVTVLKNVEARDQKIEANEDVVPVRAPVSELSVLET